MFQEDPDNRAEYYLSPADSRLMKILLMFAEKKSIDHIVDIGCGLATTTINLIKGENRSALCIDINRDTLNIAKKYAIFHKVDDKIDFINSDFRALDNLKLDQIIRSKGGNVLILAQGGITRFIGFQSITDLVEKHHSFVKMVYISDLVWKEGMSYEENGFFIPFQIPNPVKKYYNYSIYNSDKFKIFSESEFECMFCDHNLDVELCFRAPYGHWNGYYRTLDLVSQISAQSFRSIRGGLFDQSYFYSYSQKYIDYIHYIIKPTI